MSEHTAKRLFTQDWHIHTEASYDATLPYRELVNRAREIGITEFGITEHVNYPFMEKHLQISRKMFEQNYVEGMHFGVELSPMSNFQQNYSAAHEWPLYPLLLAGMHPEFVEGFGYENGELIRRSDEQAKPYLLGLTEDEIQAAKVEYVVAAAHVAFGVPLERNALIRHWHEQQMFCATDSRVDIVGHSWWAPWNSKLHFLTMERGTWPTELAWFDDFSVVPQSMHDEFAAALRENDTCAEVNVSFFTTGWISEKFKHQYAEYIRTLFENGVRITIGTDSHDEYNDAEEMFAAYLGAAGFRSDDFSVPNFRMYE